MIRTGFFFWLTLVCVVLSGVFMSDGCHQSFFMLHMSYRMANTNINNKNDRKSNKNSSNDNTNNMINYYELGRLRC